MYCSECGRKLTESARFCPNCGMAVDIEEAPHEAWVSGATVRAAVPERPGGTPIPARSVPGPSPVRGTRGNKGLFFILGAVGIILLLVIGYFVSPSGPGQEAAFRQWMTTAGSFYQGYFRIENEFETVNQNPQTTHPQAVQAWTRLMQGLQGMQGQLTALQPPPGAARDDGADMAQIHQLWSDLLAVEVQMGQQLLQYSRQGQRPPAAFLQGTLPRLWQTKNKRLQDQQQFLVRLAVRHRVSAVNANTLSQQQATQ